MKVLVTGGTGFLGKHLTEKLEEKGYDVTSIGSKDCDLTKEGSLERKFEGQNFDQIFHLAAWTQAGDFCLKYPGDQWIMNQKINTNVLSWWKDSQREAKMIAMGTSCTYAPEDELKEENYFHGEPIESLFTYAQTKRMLFAGMKAFNKQFGMDYLHAVPSTLYGPGYHTDGRQMHFVFDLMRKIIEGKEKGKEVVLWGDGHQRRELVHVDDFTDTLLALNETEKNKTFNIGADRDYSIREFAQIICDSVGYDFSKIKFDTSKYVGAKKKFLDSTRLREVYKKPFKSAEEGIPETVEWMLENRDKIFD